MKRKSCSRQEIDAILNPGDPKIADLSVRYVGETITNESARVLRFAHVRRTGEAVHPDAIGTVQHPDVTDLEVDLIHAFIL